MVNCSILKNLVLTSLFSCLLSCTYSQFSFGSDSLTTAILEAQSQMDRAAMDSLADLMFITGSANNDQRLIHDAYYFKSDGLSRSDPKKSIEYGLLALAHFEKENDLFRLSRMSNVLGHGYSNIGEHRNAVLYYKACSEYSKRLPMWNSEKERKYRSRVAYNMGFTNVRQGYLDSAGESLVEAYDIAVSLKDSLLLMSVLTQFGNIAFLREDLTQALKFHIQAKNIAELSAQKNIHIVLLGVAGIYHEMGIPDSSLHYYHRIIKRAREVANISSLCVALNNCAEQYIDIGQYDKAIEMGQELMDYATDLGIKQHQLNASMALGRAYKESNRIEKASHIIAEAIASIDSDVEFDLAKDMYEFASALEEEKYNFSSALSYHKLYKQYSDSLINKESLARADELQIKYDTEQKDNQILQLENRNRLDALTHKQNMSLLGALLIGFLLISSIIYLFVKRRRLQLVRQKENIERRLLRSQMNPHFIFNAISSIQNYLFDKSDLKVALNYMSKFAELMRQILEHSREEYVVLADEIKSLENYLELQQLRYNNSFGYSIIIQDDIDVHQVMVPPLIAQPFVENAIEHGMIYRIENGLVEISFANKNEHIELSVEDNGVGSKSVEIQPKKEDYKKKSLATLITNERLQLISKANRSKFKMAVDSLGESGTLVTIQLPKIIMT